MSPESIKVARLNDEFRKGWQRIMLTSDVRALEDVAGLVNKVRLFDDFNEINYPHGEHDFGVVYWYGEIVFWKTSYIHVK